jgi:hypothetical protein
LNNSTQLPRNLNDGVDKIDLTDVDTHPLDL